MQLTLKWKNHNTLATTTTIYRSTSPINKNSLPAAHATVNAADEQYVDTVEYGKRYYYLMQNTNAKGTAFTDNKEVWALPQTGPGPQELVRGDMNLGYFGYVKHTDFVSALGLMEKLGHPFTAPTYYDVNWHKYAYKGKILFIPNYHLTISTVSIATLYDAGLVFGTDDNGAHQYGVAPRNQRRVVSIKGDDFVVRCMRMNDSVDKTWDGLNTNLTSGEWYDLVLRSLDAIPSYQVGDNLAGHIAGNVIPTDEYMVGAYRNLFQEKVQGSKATAATSAANENGMFTYVATAGYSVSTSLLYRPVLELVNDLFI